MPVASISGGDLAKVWEFRTLGLPRDAEARSLLEKIAKQVQPIMRKRNWRIMLLSEFCPSNPSLLGLNIGAGQEVRIRLRKPGRDSEFLPYESLLGTMLHELTHNVHGPHDAKFYKLLDEITMECEDLMARDITGTCQGFDGPGKRLGGHIASNMRQVVLAAAEKRARIGPLMPSGPCRLGGDIDMMQALSPVQAAAMAAERRLRDDIWCAAPDTVGEDGTQKAQEREDSKGQSLSIEKAPTIGSSSIVNTKPDRPLVLPGYHHGVEDSPMPLWQCVKCTLLNPKPLAVVCAACSSVRIDRESSKSKTWSCKFCTLENAASLDKCEACNQWRYSYGAPSAVYTPYVGS